MKKVKGYNLYLKSLDATSSQMGVFSNRDIKAGDTILTLVGKSLNTPTRTSIKISEGIHVEDEIGRFINHSCFPSCEISENKVIASRDISLDEQITFDYRATESPISSPFVCFCCNVLIN